MTSGLHRGLAFPRALLAIVVVVVAVVTLTPQAASAAPSRNPSLIINGYVEDGCLSANYSNSYIADCGSGSGYHKWRRIYLPLGGSGCRTTRADSVSR
ncbi:hypothetical protein [Cryptosporangium minutisporangium]|uniref:Uncharacterized protein n=1 Tax=Cryptosporangium minutisporangium TaxID=113569 RepID=A0ABP6T079_9ACTN